MSLTVKIKGDASQFDKTMRGVKASVGGLTSALGSAGIGAAVAGLAAGFVAVGKAVDFMQSSSEKAAGIESLTMQFETLLGSSGAAKKRMEEIAKFAASTPFEIAELSATSKLLQTMGGNLLATGEGLRMVGDAAAISGQPLQEIGLHIGRVFNAITSGTSAGESVARLQELGLMTGKVKRQFEELAEAQKKGKKPILDQSQALTLLKGVFQSTDGAMARLSTTTEGLKSNLKDNVDTLMVKFGTGFNDGLKEALKSANNFIPQLQEKFTNAGEFMGAAMTESLTGNTKKFELIGQLIGELVIAGIEAAVILSLDKLGARLGGGLANMIEADKYSWLGVMDKISGGKIAENVRSGTTSATSFGEQFRGAMQSTGVQGTLQEIEIQRQISEGVKTGINTSMSREVREGVLEAWSRQSQQATFSN